MIGMHEWGDVEAVIYARVSDDRDGRSRSTNQQVDEGERWCKRNGIPVIDIIIDDDKGASRYSRKKRDGYDRTLQLLAAPSHRRRILVNWESSRAQRDLEVYLRLRKICEESGALWCYDGRIYDMRNAEDRRRTAQDAVDDEYEVERTRKRVMRDMRANAQAGRPHGKLAYGYRIVRDERTGRPINRVPDEDDDAQSYKGTAPIVREIATRLLAGESTRSVTVDLNRRGIPAPRPVQKGPRKGQPGQWITQTVTSLMRSPTYAGLRVANGAVIRAGTWAPILTLDQHERLQALLTDPTRKTHRGTKPVWLLTYIAMCGECGGPMVRLKPRGHDMYTCVENLCTARQIEGVDRLVTEALLQRLESPDVLEMLAGGDQSAEDAFAAARMLRERLDGFIDQAADGALSPQALARIEAKLRPQIVAAERRARASFNSPLVAEVAGPQARERWESLEMPQRRELARALVEVRIFKARKGMRGVNPNYIHLRWVGSDEPVPTGPPIITPLEDGGDPLNFTVPEVLSYLRDASEEEKSRVVLAERTGRNRFKIARINTEPCLEAVAIPLR